MTTVIAALEIGSNLTVLLIVVAVLGAIVAMLWISQRYVDQPEDRDDPKPTRPDPGKPE